MANIYTASGIVTIGDSAAEMLATIENPADSGLVFAIIGLVPFPTGDGNPPGTRVLRYAGTVGAVEVDAGAIPVPWANTVTSPPAKAVVRTVESHTFSPPGGAQTFGGELAVLALLPPSAPVFVLPGETGVLDSVEGGGGTRILFAVQWAEIPLSTRVVHLASSTLPAAGAYTTTAAYALPDGTKSVTFWNTYTRGAAGGYALHQIQWGNGTESAAPEGILSTAVTIAQPNGQVQLVNGIIEGPHPQSASALAYPPITVTVPAGATTVRMVSAEFGVTGTPGTLLTAITTSAT